MSRLSRVHVALAAAALAAACTGSDGADGTSGADGTDGLNGLVSISDEPAGANCAEGGVRVDTGLDDDGDGVLDPEEIDATSYVCDGGDGGESLVTTTPEPAGANCANGGQRIDHGVDDDGDGVLDVEEIDGTTYVCNGDDGTDGLDTLVSTTTEAPGANCANGGTRVDHGVDDDADGVLDAEEIDGTTYVCSGLDSLVVVTYTPAGGICVDGGIRVDHGVDDDGDGVLDAAEIDGTSYVCDGAFSLASCAEILSVSPAAPDGPYSIDPGDGGGARDVYCDMTSGGDTYEELAFGQHGASIAGYTEASILDLQDPVIQQAFIHLYNAQGSAMINAQPFTDNNCCFRTADATDGQWLQLGGNYVYPSSTDNVIQCNVTHSSPTLRFHIYGAAEFSPDPMPTDYFATRTPTLGGGCVAGVNPAFFWRRY